MRTRPWWGAITIMLVTLSLDGCCLRSSKCAEGPPRPEAPSEPSPLGPHRTDALPSSDLAVVVTREGIVTLDDAGQLVDIVVPDPSVSWCRVDPIAHALWLRHGEAGALSVVDLLAEPGPPVTMLERTPPTVAIAYPQATLGRPRPDQFTEGVVVHMRDSPYVEAILGCDGNLAEDCFDVVSSDARAERLAELRLAFQTQPLLETRALEFLVARAKGGRLAPAPVRSPLPERVRTVPREPCVEIPDDCGNAERLPGTALWLVEVANVAGESLFITKQLYDPAQAVFFDPQQPDARSPQPLGDGGETFVPAWVSPGGTRGLSSDTLAELAVGGRVLANGFAGICGFWDGGWEVSSEPSP